MNFHKLDESSMWYVTPASSCLGKAFLYMVRSNRWRSRMRRKEVEEKVEEELDAQYGERRQLNERQRRLEMQKASLLRSIELGQQLGIDGSGGSDGGSADGRGSGGGRSGSMGQRLAAGWRRQADWRDELRDSFHEILREERVAQLQQRHIDERVAQLEARLEDTVVARHQRVLESFKAAMSARLQVLGADGDGSVTLGDKKNHPMYKLFKSFDATQTGNLTTAEFHRALASLTDVGVFVEQRTAEYLTQAFDKDSDGTISYEEFLEMLLNADEKMAEDGPDAEVGSAPAGVAGSGAASSAELALALQQLRAMEREIGKMKRMLKTRGQGQG
jgi:Ca2+-binding EF-hand superfamily protein